MDLIERYRLAETYLNDGAPLAALETLQPMEVELSGLAAAQQLLGRAYFHSAQLSRARASRYWRWIRLTTTPTSPSAESPNGRAGEARPSPTSGWRSPWHRARSTRHGLLQRYACGERR